VADARVFERRRLGRVLLRLDDEPALVADRRQLFRDGAKVDHAVARHRVDAL
jgi:hypothetical protein